MYVRIEGKIIKYYCVSEDDESESLFLNFRFSLLFSMRSSVEPRYGGLGRTMLPTAAAARVREGDPGGGGTCLGFLGLVGGGSGNVVSGVTLGGRFRLPTGSLSATPGWRVWKETGRGGRSQGGGCCCGNGP